MLPPSHPLTLSVVRLAKSVTVFYGTLPLHTLSLEDCGSVNYNTEKLIWFYFGTSAEFAWIPFLHKQKVPKGCTFRMMLVQTWMASDVFCFSLAYSTSTDVSGEGRENSLEARLCML